MAITVGIVGVGAMGAPIAAHLARAGHKIVGYDIDPQRVAAVTALGGKAGDSPGATVAASDVTLLLLPSVKALEEVIQDIAARAPKGALVLECGTFPIAAKERAREVLAARGVALMDCPLSGTAAQVAEGHVSMFVSGERGDYARARPVIEAFTQRSDYVGGLGNGMRMKLVANTLVCTHTAAAAEALAFAQRLGLDVALTHEVLSASPAAGSTMLKHRGALMVSGRYEPAGGALAILVKDAGIIAEAAQATRADMPLFQIAKARYEKAIEKGKTRDAAAVYEEFSPPPRAGSRA